MPTPSSDDFERECDLIRHELHDGACQYVAAAMALLEAYRNRNGGSMLADSGDFDTALKHLDRASVELRRLVRGLSPLHLNDEGILRSIEDLITESWSSCGPEIEFCHDGEFDQLPPHWHVAILRIVQECLANACRHSHSNHILVGLTQEKDRIGIQVQDWGTGFDLKEVGDHSHGLKSIRYRAESLGGGAIIDACRGKGTCIMVELPLPGQDAPPSELRQFPK
jgi:two-component system, NarL family, sensor histidine kinase DegS